MSVWIYIAILAVVQGIAEFLPISSSGHLAVLGALFDFRPDESLSLGIVLHAGSLLAIVVFYFRTLLGFFRRDQFHLLLMVVLGSVPAGVAGVLLKLSGMGEMLFGDLLLIGMAFLITGTVLHLTGKKKLIPTGEHTELRAISWRQSLIIGLTQMVAIGPGISRSGSTISAGLLCGVSREAAAAFSFLLALPAIAGAAFLELLSLLRESGESGLTLEPGQLVFAVALSAGVSFGALAFLVRMVRKGRLDLFSWYMFAVGAAVIIWRIAVTVRG